MNAPFFPSKIKATQRRKAMNGTEYHLQCFVIDLLRLYRVPGTIFYHCPNGELRSPRTGAKLKRMGVLAGVADVCIVTPGGVAKFLELKAKGGVQSLSQIEFQGACKANGCKYAVADSEKTAVKILVDWGAVSVKAARELGYVE